jgi:hypothetical protein
LNAAVSARRPSSLGIGFSSRVPRPLKYRPYWLSAPALPLAISSAVRFFFRGFGWSLFSVQSSPLFEFHLPPEFRPAVPSRPDASDQPLSWASAPYSTRRIEGPLAAGSAHPLRSVLRVWLPSRRFTPFGPLPVLFHTGRALGIRPSKPSPSKGTRHVSAPGRPTSRSSCRYTPRHSAWPARQAAVPGL